MTSTRAESVYQWKTKNRCKRVEASEMHRIVPLAFILLFFSPVYIVIKYLRWCCKEEQRESDEHDLDLEIEE